MSSEVKVDRGQLQQEHETKGESTLESTTWGTSDMKEFKHAEGFWRGNYYDRSVESRASGIEPGTGTLCLVALPHRSRAPLNAEWGGRSETV